MRGLERKGKKRRIGKEAESERLIMKAIQRVKDRASEKEGREMERLREEERDNRRRQRCVMCLARPRRSPAVLGTPL